MSSVYLGGKKMHNVAKHEMHTKNFAKGRHEDPRFWKRLGGAPDLNRKRVLDLGCGLGSLCTHIAELGAAEVLGIDLDEENIEFATGRLAKEAKYLRDRVRFLCADIRTLSVAPFDYIVSKDAFEHILNLPEVLSAAANLLKPGGRMYIALGPLYHSPFGDHGRLELKFPWAHVIVPEQMALRRLNGRHGNDYHAVEDLGLNKYTVDDYRHVLRESELVVQYYQENQSEGRIARPLEQLRRLPGVDRYLTWNIYCVLSKPSPNQ